MYPYQTAAWAVLMQHMLQQCCIDLDYIEPCCNHAALIIDIIFVLSYYSAE